LARSLVHADDQVTQQVVHDADAAFDLCRDVGFRVERDEAVEAFVDLFDFIGETAFSPVIDFFDAAAEP